MDARTVDVTVTLTHRAIVPLPGSSRVRNTYARQVCLGDIWVVFGYLSTRPWVSSCCVCADDSLLDRSRLARVSVRRLWRVVV